MEIHRMNIFKSKTAGQFVEFWARPDVSDNNRENISKHHKEILSLSMNKVAGKWTVEVPKAKTIVSLSFDSKDNAATCFKNYFEI